MLRSSKSAQTDQTEQVYAELERAFTEKIQQTLVTAIQQQQSVDLSPLVTSLGTLQQNFTVQLTAMTEEIRLIRQMYTDKIVSLERSLASLEQKYNEMTQQYRLPSELSQISRNLEAIQTKVAQQSSLLSQITTVVTGVDNMQKQMNNLDWLISRLTPDELETVYGFVQKSIRTSLTLITTMNRNHVALMQQIALNVREVSKGQETMQQGAEQIEQILLHKGQSSPENVVTEQRGIQSELPEGHNQNNALK